MAPALIALTLTPMLASRLPEHENPSRFAAAMDRFFKKLASIYERVLRFCIGRPWGVVTVLAALIGVAAGFLLDHALTVSGRPTFVPAVSLPIMLVLLGAISLPTFGMLVPYGSFLVPAG